MPKVYPGLCKGGFASLNQWLVSRVLEILAKVRTLPNGN